MGTIETLSKMFFIMDSSGNYYRLDSDNQLVVADGKEDAIFFTYEDADMRIGSGKRSHFYQIVQAAESTGVSDDDKESDFTGGSADRETECETVMLSPEDDSEKDLGTKADSMIGMEDAGKEAKDSLDTDCRETVDETGNEPKHDAGMSDGEETPLKRWSSEGLADLSGIDWLMYLQNFSYIVANIREYREQVNAELSKVEKTLCDLLHFVEFFDPDVCRVTIFRCRAGLVVCDYQGAMPSGLRQRYHIEKMIGFFFLLLWEYVHSSCSDDTANFMERSRRNDILKEEVQD